MDVAEAISVIATHGLRGARVRLPQTFSNDEWEAMCVLIESERLCGLALAAADDGVLALTEQQRNAVGELHASAMADVLRLDALAAFIAAASHSCGIALLLHKGYSYAQLDYAHPELRSYVDVDVLVRGDQFDALAELLASLGFRRRFSEPRAGFVARFGKGVCFEGPTGLEIDVHRAFASGPFGLQDQAPVWEGNISFDLAQIPVTTLNPAQRCVAAATHAVLGGATPTIRTLRDVAQILEHVEDPQAVIAFATAMGLTPVLARAILAVHDQLDLEVPTQLSAWAVQHRSSSRDRILMRFYCGDHRSYAAQMVLGVVALRGWSNRWAYIRALAMPDHTHLESRDVSLLRRFLRSVRSLRSRR